LQRLPLHRPCVNKHITPAAESLLLARQIRHSWISFTKSVQLLSSHRASYQLHFVEPSTMEATPLTKPSPSVQATSRRMSFDDNSEKHFEQQHVRPKSEFDPCANAKITSPFYLYKHDSPRPSYDPKSRPDVHITVNDLEAQTPTLTPTVSQEKRRGSADSGKVKIWSRPWHRPATCMTKKKVSRWKMLLPWQRLAIKILVAALLCGLIVGVAVGVSLKVNGGVWKSNNQSSDIG
jgi:hypothetical protein